MLKRGRGLGALGGIFGSVEILDGGTWNPEEDCPLQGTTDNLDVRSILLAMGLSIDYIILNS